MTVWSRKVRSCETISAPHGVAAQPVFQPFQHGDIQVVGGLIQQQQLRIAQQHQRQRQARLLPAAQQAHRQVRVEPIQPQPGQDLRRAPGFGFFDPAQQASY